MILDSDEKSWTKFYQDLALDHYLKTNYADDGIVQY